MENEKTFRTKTGYCHISPDKIILTRDGIIGNVAKVTVGNRMTRTFIIYGALTLWLFYTSYSSYRDGQLFNSILFLLLALWMGYAIISSLNNSATPVIERNKIMIFRIFDFYVEVIIDVSDTTLLHVEPVSFDLIHFYKTYSDQ